MKSFLKLKSRIVLKDTAREQILAYQ